MLPSSMTDGGRIGHQVAKLPRFPERTHFRHLVAHLPPHGVDPEPRGIGRQGRLKIEPLAERQFPGTSFNSPHGAVLAV